MSASPHRLILASAGTGKTYQLSGHFLRLLFEGVEPERILATTFTRKAAGEILDRVLERLLEATGDARKLAELQAQVPGRKITREGCVLLLARLARGLDRFRVRTLDSFFVHLAKLFALDLELPPEWTLVDELDDEELRAQAVGRVLADCSQGERLELLRGLQREAGGRSVHQALLAVVREARGMALESSSAAWDPVPLPEGPTEHEVAALRERLAALEAPQTQKGTPVQHWLLNLERAREAVEAGEWEELLGLGLVGKIVAGDATFSRRDIDDETAEVLGELARHAARELVAEIGARTRACRDFLERFEEAYQALKRERGAYRFEDLPLALSPAADGGPTPFDERQLDLWFRLDGKLDHLLLDEFQDTAPAQWRALAHLAEEVLADGTGERSFFCVGDVKQSIYGWRQAEPRLLAGLGDRFGVLGTGEPLTRSYRSSPIVLETVNRVFGALDGCRVLSGDDRPARIAAAARWHAGFTAHSSAREHLPGAALLLEASFAGPEEKASQAACRLAVQRVVELAREAPEASIGVLVRTRRPIAGLLFALRARGVRASGEGGNPLVDAEPVQVFLSGLHLADHPGDTAAALHVASSPLGEALGLPPGADELPEARRGASRALRASLVERGYGAVLAELLPVVEAGEAFSSWDRRRFRQLVDLAHAHDARAGLRPSAFAELVRATPVEDPSASKVRVMTIHASKGLEFAAVVLPELDQPLVNGRSRFVCARPDPFGAIERVSMRPKKELAAFSKPLRELVEAVEERECEESLAVLYVAMTRAARRIEMILPPPPRSGNPSEACTYANLLRETLGAGPRDEEGVVWRHPEGVEAWHAGLEGDEAATAEPAAEQPPLRLAPVRRARMLPTRSPSAEEGGAKRPADLLRPPSSAAATRGTLVHRLFEELEWLEDFERTDAELLALLSALEPDEAPRRQALELFRRALEGEELRALLSRPGAHATVLRERAFRAILPAPGDDGEGAPGAAAEELWSGSIDRLVLLGDPDRPSAAEVIDFKTDDVGSIDGVDEIDASALGPRVAYYRPQLAAYRRVVAAQTGLPEARIACRLAFVAPGRVVTLPPV